MFKYNHDAERAAKAAGINLFNVERACRPYVDALNERKKAMYSGDAELFQYLFSSGYDREKHAAHNKAINAIIGLNKACQDHGLEVIFDGDETNRQELGQFACQFTGYYELTSFVD